MTESVPDLNEADSIIRIDNIVKIFKSKVKTVTAVNDVSFKVYRGRSLVFSGRTGPGKAP